MVYFKYYKTLNKINMKNQFKIVMLPTEKASNIGYWTAPNGNRNLMFNPPNSEFTEPQHFYIVDTQATIEVGDFVYHQTIQKVSDVFKINIDELKTSEGEWWKKDCLKVVVSTDASLGLPLCNDEYFLQAICSYGIDGIEDIKVEVNPYFNICSISWKKKQSNNVQ